MWDFRFYEASAQILPVLYLAVLVEYRLLHEHWEDRPPLFRAIMATAGWVLALSFTLGEFEALHVVSRGEAPAGQPVLIHTAYLLAFVTLVWPLWERAQDAQDELGRLRSWLISIAGLAAFVVVLGVVKVLVP